MTDLEEFIKEEEAKYQAKLKGEQQLLWIELKVGLFMAASVAIVGVIAFGIYSIVQWSS